MRDVMVGDREAPFPVGLDPVLDAVGAARIVLLREGERRVLQPFPGQVEDRTAPSDQIAEVLADALELGVLDKVDAWVVFQSRVNRIAIPELAAGAGVGARWLWRRRERAEDELVSAGRSALQCLGPSAKAV
jgi:hypothetical protein